ERRVHLLRAAVYSLLRALPAQATTLSKTLARYLALLAGDSVAIAGRDRLPAARCFRLRLQRVAICRYQGRRSVGSLHRLFLSCQLLPLHGRTDRGRRVADSNLRYFEERAGTAADEVGRVG